VTIALTSTGDAAHVRAFAAGEQQQPVDQALQPFGLSAGGLDAGAGRVDVAVEQLAGPLELEPQPGERCAELVRGITRERSLLLQQLVDLARHRVERPGEPAHLRWSVVLVGPGSEVAGRDGVGAPLEPRQRTGDGARHEDGGHPCTDERDERHGHEAAHLVAGAFVDDAGRVADTHHTDHVDTGSCRHRDVHERVAERLGVPVAAGGRAGGGGGDLRPVRIAGAHPVRSARDSDRRARCVGHDHLGTGTRCVHVDGGLQVAHG